MDIDILRNAYMEVDEFDRDNPKEFLKALKKNKKPQCYTKLGTPLNILFFSKVSKKLRKWNIIKENNKY